MNISSSRTSRGTLFGIGVGPGDPDLLTLQAIKRLEKVDIIRTGKVRRAKLYYLRDRVGKAAKVKEAIR